MKKTVKIMILILLLIACFSIRAAANSKEGEYVIARGNDGYLLYGSVGEGTYSSIGECLGAIIQPTSITFSDITVDEPILLPKGEYNLSGKLDSGGVISIPAGATVSMKDMTLTLGGEAYIRIKGGALAVESSSITGSGQLIRLDYSSSSTLKILSGSIMGETDKALIDIENGRALISGADIENKGGAAIRSDSELCLSGSPIIKGATYGIILESPMYMGAYTNEYYSQSPLAVQYLDSFQEGTLTEIFYESTDRSLSNVTLYDKDGKRAEITHFRDSVHTEEKNFGGVYLPHTVKFFVRDKQVSEVKLLSGERITFPVTDGVVGYEFDNWYRDREGNDAYSQDKRVYSSFSLYGIYTLNAPTFSISSLDFTYDGEDHTLAFDTLSHPLDGGYYTYTWYKNGEEISNLSLITLRNVADSGTYSCKVTYNLGGDSASIYAENIKVNIKKREVDVPLIPLAKYNGLPQYPAPDASDLYTWDVISGIDAGVYPITFTLTDPSNFSWRGSDKDSITSSFEITRAENGWVSMPSAKDTYIGFPLGVSAVPLFGEVGFIYSATENGTYTQDVPTSIGSYYVKAIVRESKNYSPLVSSPISFSILPEEVIGLEMVTAPSKTEYFAFDKLDMSGMEIAAVYNSGRREVISLTRLTCTYNDGKSLRVGDTSVAIEYLGASLQIPVSVYPLSYDLSSFDFTAGSITYDGNYHTITPIAGSIIGLDGIPLDYDLVGGGKDAGEYTVSVIFFGESRDYVIPDKISATLTILPCEVDLVWTDTEFIYDSSPKIPSAYFIDAMGVKRDVTVCGSAMLAGDNYTATATVYSKNYTYKNPTCAFLIAKADYDMSEIYWSDSSLVYNGRLQEVTLENLPEGISVVGYTDNRATNAGKYTATASLKYDERNYNAPTAPSYEWEIKPAQYDMSQFEFVSAEYEYDGEEHFPMINGEIPLGADGIKPTYTFSRGAINTADGAVTVTLTFSTESKNYVAPAPLTAKVKILPKGIYVVWMTDDFVYDGKVKSPTADSPLAKIKISGSGINAGSYTATAASLDPNYEIINSTYNYEIAKAANRWITEPQIEDFYESKTPNPVATPYFGRVEFGYYSDPSATVNVSPTKPGEYFMVATVPESENHLSLTYAPIAFTCIEVVPTGMRIELIGIPIAFTSAESMIKGYLIYNDGSETQIPENTVSIRYQNGDSLRCADTQMEISYSGFTEIIPISVAPASYDLSSIFWDRTLVEYDGIPHAPTLEGLPDGIGIIGYVGESAVNAGEYTFSVMISYDEENYLPPKIPDCTLTITKAKIAAPSDMAVEYNGSSVSLPTNTLWTAASELSIKNSGEYKVTYSILDGNNYVFENGDDTYEGKITVSPRKLTVTVSDFTLYWLESDISPDYTVEGEVAEGDTLDIYFYVENEMIYASSRNPNYSLTVIPGALERLPYPSEEMKGKIITAILILVILTLFIILIFKKRNDLYDLIRMLRARKKHRDGIGFIDNSPAPIAKDLAPKELQKINNEIPPLGSIVSNTNIAINLPSAEIAKSDRIAPMSLTPAEAPTEINVQSTETTKLDITLIDANPVEIQMAVDSQSSATDPLATSAPQSPNVTNLSKRQETINLTAGLICDRPSLSSQEAIEEQIKDLSEKAILPEEANEELITSKEESIMYKESYEEETLSKETGEEIISSQELFDNEYYEYDNISSDFINSALPKSKEDIQAGCGGIESKDDSINEEKEIIQGEDTVIDEEEEDEVLTDKEDDILDVLTENIYQNHNQPSDFREDESMYCNEAFKSTETADLAPPQTPEPDEPSIEIKMEYANAAITNAMAKKLIKDEREVIYTSGKVKSIINVDTLSRSFVADDRVDVNILKKKSLVPYDTNYIKVLARGAIDKPLHVFANEFSLAAVKMILLSGGEVIRVISEKSEKNKTKK